MLNITLLLPLVLHGGGVDWAEGSAFEAIRQADADDQSTWIYFWSGESESCASFNTKVLADAEAISRLESFVCIGANPGNTEGRKLVDKYHIQTLPSIIILGPDGQVEDAIIGFIEAEGFVSEMDRVLRNEGTVSDLKAKLAAVEGEFEATIEGLDALAVKLNDVGQSKQAHVASTAILEMDPKGKTLVGARVGLEKVAYGLEKRPIGEEAYVFELKPLYKHVKKIKQPKVQMAGWTMLANYEAFNENHAMARTAHRNVWKKANALEENATKAAMNKGVALVDYFYSTREGISKGDAKFALAVAEEVMELRKASVETCEDGACTEGCQGCGQAMEAAFLYRVACAQQMCGKEKEAVHTLDQALEIAPGDKELLSFRDQVATSVNL